MTKASDLHGVPGLEEFIGRMSLGMEVSGRIVEVLEENMLILRVWGNNILTESNYKFNKFDEVILQVQSVKPSLIFKIRPTQGKKTSGMYA